MKNLLVIGGKENIRHLHQKDLEALGCQVNLATSLEDGESKIRKEQPDIIALETCVPKEEELVFLEKCRKEHGDIPFVLCTSHGKAKQNFSVWASHAHVIQSANLQELKMAIKAVLA